MRLTRPGREPAPASGPGLVVWRVCLVTAVALYLLVMASLVDVPDYRNEPLTLPEAVMGRDERRDEDLVVNVMKDGAYRVMSRTYASDDLENLLCRLSLRKMGPDRYSSLHVVVRCDAYAPYEYVNRLLEICRRARVWRLSFGVSPGRRTYS